MAHTRLHTHSTAAQPGQLIGDGETYGTCCLPHGPILSSNSPSSCISNTLPTYCPPPLLCTTTCIDLPCYWTHPVAYILICFGLVLVFGGHGLSRQISQSVSQSVSPSVRSHLSASPILFVVIPFKVTIYSTLLHLHVYT